MIAHLLIFILLEYLRLDNLSDALTLSLLTRPSRLLRDVDVGTSWTMSPLEDISDLVALPRLGSHSYLGFLLEQRAHPAFPLNKNSADVMVLTLAWNGIALSSLAQ